MAEVTFTEAALDDLRRLGPDAVVKVLKKVLLLHDNPEAGYPLGSELTGFRKLVVGRNTWRIVYRITDDKIIEICEVWAIGARADAQIYDEATARVRAAGRGRPVLIQLTAVLERMGTIAKDLEIERPPARDPVPDWLANRLIHTAGMAREDVAALDLQQAVDRWTDFISKPH
jgi:mRNA interferase RelE/StbE